MHIEDLAGAGIGGCGRNMTARAGRFNTAPADGSHALRRQIGTTFPRNVVLTGLVGGAGSFAKTDINFSGSRRQSGMTFLRIVIPV
jgi:hypothetical protein